MNIEQLKIELPDYAKDIKLNLGSVLSEAGSTDLTQKQIDSIALASAYAARNADVITAVTHQAAASLSDDEINAMKAAATIMAMNNIYYRFTHSMSDSSYGTMPARLRMNVMANPGVDKILFELGSLAVSAINGCGMCMNSHAVQLEKAGASKQMIQSTVRIASVIHAAAVGREIG
jgi:lipoyl-dependent peroxiredoxin subunit D